MSKLTIFLSVFATLLSFTVQCQDCQINNWQGNKPFILGQDNNAYTMYDHIVNDTSSNWHILLVRFGAQLNNQTITNLNICGENTVVISKQSRTKKSKELLNDITADHLHQLLSRTDATNGFFSTTCKNYISTKQSELLVIKNQKLNKWIEVYVSDGNLLEVLNGKKEYDFLTELYKFLKQIDPN